MTFTYFGCEYELFRHLYNSTWLNERGVELAVWQAWRQDRYTLEVGNVLNHYEPLRFSHRVVDRYERAPGVENRDVFSVQERFSQIVSLSTLEHVRWDEEPREDDGAVRALEHLLTLLEPDGRMLVTVPTGHNPGLDDYLSAGVGVDRVSTLVREGDLFAPVWRQTDEPVVLPYGGEQPWAQAVWIAEWQR